MLSQKSPQTPPPPTPPPPPPQGGGGGGRKGGNKNLEKQKEVLKEFTNYVWDVANINHLVLAINVFIEGAGIDYSVLERLGFIGRNGVGSILYTLLNPNYMELVETFAKDSEAINSLKTGERDIKRR